MGFFESMRQFFVSIGELIATQRYIEQIEFANDEVLIRFLGNLRYIIGDVPYNLIFLSIQIGGAVIIFKLLRQVLNMIAPLIPGLGNLRFS
jgi:hypothetical protein